MYVQIEELYTHQKKFSSFKCNQEETHDFPLAVVGGLHQWSVIFYPCLEDAGFIIAMAAAAGVEFGRLSQSDPSPLPLLHHPPSLITYHRHTSVSLGLCASLSVALKGSGFWHAPLIICHIL
jgi:hypothetical protein